eukprot:CAMPEP_0117066666 /NCGR_PEP_ID=MMETSP0472-20121206/46637_1 /TAXON_ID=693140 ORGANISM="Tiarina fusus, Strain LIS" /NCGR_SAMPLE_ID=MMETSP0472 /ASSEMBLY_ACC=CAM_ASM_000603 /LENGTH=55 /DNA_ID=CAMNT_0004787845 /DNA_START=43 /DNA_END=206 /DNA_ORIENTATION=+
MKESGNMDEKWGKELSRFLILIPMKVFFVMTRCMVWVFILFVVGVLLKESGATGG